MDDKQRLQLQNMISANDVKDQTSLIRELKHSVILTEEIKKMIILKNKYKDDLETLNRECVMECNFLFTNYTDIFNKIKKDEINMNILFNFLGVLKRIEDGELDQHEASFLVGTILKELYIDSALKKADKLNAQYEKEEEEPKKEALNVSWKQYKSLNNL